jgi:hypothetical protein
MNGSEFDVFTGVGKAIVTTSRRMAMRAACACFLLLITSWPLLLAQIGRAGRLDTSFGNGRVFITNPGSNLAATSVALQSAGTSQAY